MRIALNIWFLLIGASTLLTYQHHAIDLIGGAVLGALCLHVFQDEPLAQPVVRNRRIGLYYLVGALSFGIATILLRPWGVLLLWPATSLGLVASGYFRFGAGIFRKRDGVLPFTTRILLWPVLIGQRLSLAYYSRQARPWDAVSDELWIGRKLSDRAAQRAIDLGITAVLDLAGEFSDARPFQSIDYHQLPILDLTAPTPEQLDEAVDFIRAHANRGIVYVHCKAGYSRTAAVAGAYLLATKQVETVEEAVDRLRSARPQIVIRAEAMQALRDYAARFPAHVKPSSSAIASPLAFAAIPSTR
jgi:predicted protein tyrosine phosphatase